uniref:Uncharacterized protein n=1 Tax=Biomphalaria glabrata TaxID=6526 RepID=A0A2C9LPT6_BIOGL
MYYRKGTDQHLTFLRNMREAHAMYPFTGKRDKELFDKALAELFLRLPILRLMPEPSTVYFLENARTRNAMRMSRWKARQTSIERKGKFMHISSSLRLSFC